MAAVWLLEEASGTRFDATTNARNLTEGAGTINNNTSQKMEGNASAEINNRFLTTSNAALANISAPFTCFLWMRYTDGAGGQVHLFQNSGAVNGLSVLYNTTPQTFAVTAYNAGGTDTYTSTQTVAFNTWAHVAVRRTTTASALFLNGKLEGSKVHAMGSPTNGPSFTLSYSSNAFFAGEFDEAGCTTVALSDAALCRICSCGVRGEQCVCNGLAFTNTGRNASTCGSCTLPADCAVATPP